MRVPAPTARWPPPGCRRRAELPYELEVLPISCRPLQDGSVRVQHQVLVVSERVKKIVVGKKGAAIGAVGRWVARARAPAWNVVLSSRRCKQVGQRVHSS